MSQNVLRRSLPNRVSNLLVFFFTIPIFLAISKAIEVSHGNTSGLMGSVAYIALFGIGVSVLFAALSYLIPDLIVNNTSLPAFFLWIIIYLSFALSTLLHSQAQFAQSCAAAVAALFFLFMILYLDGISSSAFSVRYEAGGVVLIIRGLSIALAISCIISISVMLIISIVEIDVATSIYTSTLLHVIPFAGWLGITFLASGDQSPS